MAIGDTCTPVYGLPYATGSSRPCNIDQTICAFSNATQTQIDRLAGVRDRTASTIPMAKVALTVPTPYTASNVSGPLVFDSVLVDTDNMFSSEFPDQMVINTPGIYAAFGALSSTSATTSSTLTTSNIRIDVSGFLGNFMFANSPYPSGAPINQAGTGTWMVSSAGTVMVMTYSPFIQGTDIVTVTYAEFGLVWLSDLP